MNNIAALADARVHADLGHQRAGPAVSAREAFGLETEHRGAGLLGPDRARAGDRRRLHVRPRDDAGDRGRVRLQPPGADPGLSRHRQVHPCRAGGGAAELALHPRQPRQPHQPHRPDRQGRHRAQGWQAGHRVPRGHPALGAAARLRAGVRRVRRGPAGRDVRDPARARGRGPADAARPEQGDPPAPELPPVRDGEHGRPGRHDRALSRHAADQPRPDGPLEHRGHAELPAARAGDGDRDGQGRDRARTTRPRRSRSRAWWRWPT